MDWSPRVNPSKSVGFTDTTRLGIYDDLLLHDVGWEALCALYGYCHSCRCLPRRTGTLSKV